MGWNDWLTSGGLFGGYGQYGGLPQQDLQHANNLGLMAAGASLLSHAVEPGNFNYGGNVTGSLMAGAGLFNQQLDQAAQLAQKRAELAQREQERLAKLKEEQDKRDAEQAKFDAEQQKSSDTFNMNEGKHTALMNAYSIKYPNTQPDVLAAMTDEQLSKPLLPVEPKAPSSPVTREFPDGSLREWNAETNTWKPLAYKLPEAAKTPKDDFAKRALDESRQMVETPGPFGSVIKVPKYKNMNEAVAAVRQQDAIIAEALAPKPAVVPVGVVAPGVVKPVAGVVPPQLTPIPNWKGPTPPLTPIPNHKVDDPVAIQLLATNVRNTSTLLQRNGGDHVKTLKQLIDNGASPAEAAAWLAAAGGR